MNDRQNLTLEIGTEKSPSSVQQQQTYHEDAMLANPSSSKIQYAVSKKWETEVSSGQRPKPTATNVCSDIFCCCSRRVGSMFFICERRNGSPIVVAGPCWPFCTFVTFPLIAGLSGLTLYFCILRENAALVSANIFLMQWIPVLMAASFSCPIDHAHCSSLFLTPCLNNRII